ncbi:MAG: hypothetical protein ACXWAT_13225 [Methylobacter sp.]
MQSWQNKLIVIDFCLVFLISGCTDVQVQEDRKIVTSIEGNEKISFILDQSAITDVKDAQKIEKKIEECIDKALKKLNPPVQTVTAESFRNTAFPGIDYLSVPSSLDSLITLLKSSTFRERINPLGLRYLLVLHSEYSSQSKPVGGCFGGAGGGVCLAFIVWSNETKMSACVLDLDQGCNAGEVKATAVGHPWMGIVLIFPMGFPAFSEGPACNALGKQVATFIAGNQKKQ